MVVCCPERARCRIPISRERQAPDWAFVTPHKISDGLVRGFACRFVSRENEVAHFYIFDRAQSLGGIDQGPCNEAACADGGACRIPGTPQNRTRGITSRNKAHDSSRDVTWRRILDGIGNSDGIADTRQHRADHFANGRCLFNEPRRLFRCRVERVLVSPKPGTLTPCRIAHIERVVPHVRVEVQVVFVPHGIGLQGLSVLTRFVVAAPIFSRRLKRVSGFSPSCSTRFRKNFPRSTFRPARGSRWRRVSEGGGSAHGRDYGVRRAARKARRGRWR